MNKFESGIELDEDYYHDEIFHLAKNEGVSIDEYDFLSKKEYKKLLNKKLTIDEYQKAWNRFIKCDRYKKIEEFTKNQMKEYLK